MSQHDAGALDDSIANWQPGRSTSNRVRGFEDLRFTDPTVISHPDVDLIKPLTDVTTKNSGKEHLVRFALQTELSAQSQAAAETARGEAAEAGARADALAAELEALHRTHAQEALARQRARTPTAIVVEVLISIIPPAAQTLQPIKIQDIVHHVGSVSSTGQVASKHRGVAGNWVSISRAVLHETRP